MKSSGDCVVDQDRRWQWWVVAIGADLGCWRQCHDGGGEVGLSLRNLLKKKKE